MKGNIEERACMLAQYIIENRTTVRAAAKKFGISKSTVHTDAPNRNGIRRVRSFREKECFFSPQRSILLWEEGTL